MSMTAFFLLLTLRLHGSGQPFGAEAWEAREPLAERVRRDLGEDDDDYEPYNTPTPELMENDTLPTSSQGTGAAARPEADANGPGSDPVELGTTAGVTPGATDRGTAASALAEEPTSGLVSTQDLPTHREVTEAETMGPTTEEATSPVPSAAQPGADHSTAGAAATESAAVSGEGSTATGPAATSPLATDTPRTAGAPGGRLLTDSAATILPAEARSRGSSPTSALTASARLSTPGLPPTSPAAARSAPPGVTGRAGPSPSSAPGATTAHLFLSGHIPVRQCLLAVLILALVATVFLVCTVVLAIRLSRKGHTYPVRDYSPTEMVCISSLMADGDPAANGGPASAKSELLKPGPDPGDDGDELTLHSFLP
ncbi:P-selectin glycoprotein ligand 1 [Sminthopsis crassicaudata]|uniref:P-selectin glycoprotein ligand 1 n=1 Tax=Sminthopsis crassicaudata TaxID=9301 RepID=UPI003D6929EC